MPEAATAPKEVLDSERIARIVSSPSMVIDGRLSPTAFNLRTLPSGPETYVSVWRLEYIIPDRENSAKIHLPEGDELFGYASIKAGECRSISFAGISLDVKSYPNKGNPYHAGICFSKGDARIKGNCQEPGFIGVKKILANRCELVAI